jgi:PII-like signaling protein
MKLSGQGKALCVLITESDKAKGRALYSEIVIKAHEMELSGATVFRGILGFGASSRVHSMDIEVLSLDLPLTVLLVDSEEKIDKFLPVISEMIGEGLIQTWPVNIELYRHTEEFRP